MNLLTDALSLLAGFLLLWHQFGWVAALGFVCLAYYSKPFTKE